VACRNGRLAQYNSKAGPGILQSRQTVIAAIETLSVSGHYLMFW